MGSFLPRMSRPQLLFLFSSGCIFLSRHRACIPGAVSGEKRGPHFMQSHTRQGARKKERERSDLYRQHLNLRVCLRVCWLCFLVSNWCARFGERLLPRTVPSQLHGPRWRPLLSFCLRDTCLCVHVVFSFLWRYALVL